MKKHALMQAICSGIVVAGLLPGLLSAGVIVAPPHTLYVPIEPCRLVDTREIVGKFPAGQSTRSYYAFETGGELASQGGNPGGCGIPQNAVAVHMVLTAIDPAANGWLRVWASNQEEPNATVLNYTAGENISVGVPVPVCPGLECDEWEAKKYSGAIHLVADALGYYIPPPVVSLQADSQPQGR